MYPSTADLVAASIVPALSELTGAQQDALRAASITAVENYCRQSFTAVGTTNSPVAKKLDGSGSDTLYLPERLAELVSFSVTESDSGYGIEASDVSVSDDRARLSVGATSIGATWADRALADVQGGRNPAFPSGVDNVVVAGVWGWTDAEYAAELSAVTTAIRYDMEDKALAGANHLAETVRSARALGLTSVSQGRLSINLGAMEVDLSVRARRILKDLVFEHVGGASV
jgi:hypothetical protein